MNKIKILIWISYPGRRFFSENNKSVNLYWSNIKHCLEAIQLGCKSADELICMILGDDISQQNVAKAKYETEIKEIFNLTPEVLFIDEYSCQHDTQDSRYYHKLNDKKDKLSCREKHRLMFIDEQGTPYACYGV